jgi:hypothetical protein
MNAYLWSAVVAACLASACGGQPPSPSPSVIPEERGQGNSPDGGVESDGSQAPTSEAGSSASGIWEDPPRPDDPPGSPRYR